MLPLLLNTSLGVPIFLLVSHLKLVSRPDELPLLVAAHSSGFWIMGLELIPEKINI